MSAKHAAASPTDASVAPTKSSGAGLSVLDSGTWRDVMRNVTTASGTLMRNTKRHDHTSMNQPPRNGPIALATPPSPDHTPIARGRSSGWNDAPRIARLPGTSNAPPAPCTARAMTRNKTLGAAAHATLASVKSERPNRNTRLRPNRSPSAPPSSKKAVSVTRYASSVHWSPATSVCRSLPIDGSATFTTVPSRNAMPEPSTVAAITQRAVGVPQRITFAVCLGCG